jgi:hypothetical protein
MHKRSVSARPSMLHIEFRKIDTLCTTSQPLSSLSHILARKRIAMFTSNSSLPDWALEVPNNCPLEEFLFNETYGRHKITQSRNPLTCGVTGRTFSTSELRRRVDLLARGIGQSLGWQPNKGTQWQKVVCVYSESSVNILIWHRSNIPC